jgi:hypothetical protein
MSLQIDRLAIHYIDTINKKIDYAKSEENVKDLRPAILEFFLRLVKDVIDAEDAGPTYSAKFFTVDDELGPSVVNQHIQNIVGNEESFFEESKSIANHLFKVSPPNASAGVLAVILLREHDGKNRYISLIKIRHVDRNFVTLLEASLTQLGIEEVKKMLLEEIQKGAIIPHPDREKYELKLIDKQIPGEPAIYFVEKFLGCRTKISDDNQVKGIITALQDYGAGKKLPVLKEKLPEVIATLQETGKNVSTKSLAETVQKVGLFDGPVDSKDLVSYIEEKSEIGPIDIPVQSFSKRGKTGRTSRQMRYRFSDPQYKNVTISGPVDLLGKIISIKGDTATFTIRTTRNGFSIDYD